MPTYVVELTKIIVVEIEASDDAMMRRKAEDPKQTYDGAWDRASINVEMLGCDED